MSHIELDEIELDEFDEGEIKGYFQSVKIKLLTNLFLFILAVILAVYSLEFNGSGLNVWESLDLLLAHISGESFPQYSADWYNDVLIWKGSVPRIIFTVFAGVGLAVAGVAMQSMMNNPLADPYTVGVSSGACLGLAIAMVIGLSINAGDGVTITLLSFLFALLPMVAIVLLAPKTRSSPSTLILAGVALSYLFNSVNTLLLVTVDTESLTTIYNLQTGTLSQIGWGNIPMIVVTVLIGSAIIMFLSRQLNLLSMGDASATSLGVDPDNLRIICLMAIAFIVGTIVGNAGVIGFVGLVTPHIARMMLGSDTRYVMPCSAFLSICLMFIADMLCRSMSIYDDIPVGSMLALIGAPIFMYLIVRRKSRVW